MNKNSFLARYISTHENWRTELSEYPYFLKIAEEGRFAIFNYDMTQSASIESPAGRSASSATMANIMPTVSTGARQGYRRR